MNDDVAEVRVARALRVLTAIVKSGEDLLGRAQRLAPIEEGTLRGSGELAILVNGVRLAGAGAIVEARRLVAELARRGELRRVEAEVAFTEVYAARQHEETSWRHPLGGQAKFLEQPLREQNSRYQRAVELAARLDV